MRIFVRNSLTVLAIGLLVCGVVLITKNDTTSSTLGHEFPVNLNENIRSSDCGAECLFAIIRKSGRSVPFVFLKNLTKNKGGGTSMLDLKRSAELLDCDVNAIMTSFDDLNSKVSQKEVFAILFLRHGHFVAVLEAPTPDKLRVFDTKTGVMDLSAEDLGMNSYFWDGSALIIRATKK